MSIRYRKVQNKIEGSTNYFAGRGPRGRLPPSINKHLLTFKTKSPTPRRKPFSSRRGLLTGGAQIMKHISKETWKTIINMIISILTAIATTLGVTSCI